MLVNLPLPLHCPLKSAMEKFLMLYGIAAAILTGPLTSLVMVLTSSKVPRKLQILNRNQQGKGLPGQWPYLNLPPYRRLISGHLYGCLLLDQVVLQPLQFPGHDLFTHYIITNNVQWI